MFKRVSIRPHDRLGLQVVVHAMPNNFSRIGIGYQTQIRLAFAHGQISDIGHPDLFGSCWNDVMLTGFEQIGMLAETMMTVRRFVISPFGGNQQSMRSQQGKESIAPDHHARLLQQPLQFARSNTRLQCALASHGIDNYFRLQLALPIPCTLLIPGLSTHPQKLTATDNR